MYLLPLFLSITVLLFVIATTLFWRRISELKSKVAILASQQSVNELLINEMKEFIDHQKITIEQNLIDNENKNNQYQQNIQQLEKSLILLQQNFSLLEDKFQHNVDQQPEDKLYSRAYKLAALGADLHEIMTECDLPRVEAEMLLAVYTKK